MGFVMDEDIPFGVGVLTIKDGLVLCGVRLDNGQICGPGGHIQNGETPEQAAIRETEEEFGITPTKLTVIGAFSGDDDSKPSMQYLCTEFTGTPKCDEKEMTSPAFVNLYELLDDDELDLFPAFEDACELLLDKLETSDNLDGGQGSGNWGHAGRPGKEGGSAPGGGKQFRLENQMDPEGHYPWSKYHQREQRYTGLVWAYRAEAARNKAEMEGKSKEDIDKALTRALNVKPKDKDALAKDIENKAAEKEKTDPMPEGGKPTGEAKSVADYVQGATKTGEHGLAVEGKGEKLKITPVSERKYTPEQQARRDELEKIASDAGVHSLGSKHDKLVDKAEKDIDKALQKDIDYFDSKEAKEIVAHKEEVLSTVSKAFETQDFVTDISIDNTLKVLEQGFFKNQLETHTTDGADAPDLRREVSHNMFGIDETDKPQNFEKYGHLGNTYTWYGSTGGGQIQIVFDKGRMWDRTTYTMGDSLGESYQPCKVSDPKLCSFGKTISTYHGAAANMRKEADAILKTGKPEYTSYCELQYHGIVTTNDISHIRIPASMHGSPMVQTLIAKAGGLGIPVIWDDANVSY